MGKKNKRTNTLDTEPYWEYNYRNQEKMTRPKWDYVIISKYIWKTGWNGVALLFLREYKWSKWPQKGSSNPTSGYLSEGNRICIEEMALLLCHWILIHNSQDMETTKVPANEWMDKTAWLKSQEIQTSRVSLSRSMTEPRYHLFVSLLLYWLTFANSKESNYRLFLESEGRRIKGYKGPINISSW